MSDINVIVKDELNQSKVAIKSPPTTAQKAAEKADPKTESAAQTKKDNQGIAIAAMIATRSFNYITTNVSRWTGNSRNQAIVNNASQLVSLAASAMINPALGLTMMGMQASTAAIDTAYTLKMEELNAKGRRLRAGYSQDDKMIGGRK